MADTLGRRGLPVDPDDEPQPTASTTGRHGAPVEPTPQRGRFALPDDEPRPTGRFAFGSRGLPADDDDDPEGPSPVASPGRRWLDQTPELPGPEPDPLPALQGSGARRGAPQEEDEPTRSRRGLLVVGAVAAILVLLIGTIYLVAGGGRTTAEPEPSRGTGQSGASAGSNSPVPSGQPTSTGSGTAGPGGTGQVSPHTASPSPSASLAGASVVLDLTTAQVPVLPGWQLYADEKVQDNRRLIRIKQLATDTRVQVVALPGITGALADACADLVGDHRASYGSVATSAAVPVQVSAGAEGIACSFTGTRTSDGVAVRVDFTVVRRTSDAMSLVFRDTIPQTVPTTSPALSELVRMECATADSFGVTISQCAATPAQGDG